MTDKELRNIDKIIYSEISRVKEVCCNLLCKISNDKEYNNFNRSDYLYDKSILIDSFIRSLDMLSYGLANESSKLDRQYRSKEKIRKIKTGK